MSSEIKKGATTAQAASASGVFRGLLAASVAFLVGAVAWASWQAGSARIDADDARLVAVGRRVYAERCAGCHGKNLEGRPAWRERRADGRLPAPPHDASGHTWHHPDAVLIAIVSHGFEAGRYAPPGDGSDVPAFANSLTEEEIRASLAYIKSSWPDRQRALQAQVTRSTQ